MEGNLLGTLPHRVLQDAPFLSGYVNAAGNGYFSAVHALLPPTSNLDPCDFFLAGWVPLLGKGFLSFSITSYECLREIPGEPLSVFS